MGCKRRKAWLWLAVDRDTRRVVAWVVGHRGEATARRVWAALPPAYRRHARAFTDAWAAYAAAVPVGQHLPASRKGSTSLVEGLNWWLRQRGPVLVRKTCSFSKC